MKRQRGYTILEVMIFLAVSGFMLVTAVVAVGGRQQEVQFQQAARDFENKINDFISDVEIGYFNRDAGYSCVPDSFVNPEPSISYTTGASGNVQGQSGDCVLIGKAIVMGDEGVISATDTQDKGLLRIFDMAGVRLVNLTENKPAQNIEESKPAPLYNDIAPVTSYKLRYGLEVEKVVQYEATLPPQEESAQFLAIMNNARAGTADTTDVDATLNAGSTSTKVVTATFDSAVSAKNGLDNFINNWRFAGDGKSPEFKTIAICVSGPNARGISGNVSDWGHKEVAVLLVQKNGSTQLLFDESEEYCNV